MSACSFPAAMALEVRPVASRSELNTFIKLPWRLYRNERNWVPPLLFERKRFFDRQRNPFFKHAYMYPLIAYKDGRRVGRIAVYGVNRRLDLVRTGVVALEALAHDGLPFRDEAAIPETAVLIHEQDEVAVGCRPGGPA